MHAPTSSVCVLGIPLLMTFMHPLMLGNVQELVRNTWNCQNCTGILMCCLGTSKIYIIRNSIFFSLASISSHNIGYGQPNSVEIIQVHHSSSFVLKKTEDDTTVSLDNILFSRVYIWWNGMVEWNSGMDYWNGGMPYKTYLIIQHVLYSEQWALRCVLCMHWWLDGWLLHCMNFELWPRPGYTFTLWCMQGNQAPQYVSHLITNRHFSFSHTVWVQSEKKRVQLQSPWHLPSYKLGVGR